ncbi:hypothetical protein JNW91_26875 [Micromonospora sp. STR1_7]|uniref:Uncharacterized protein n=1 Tax=Micromonospora parastrephiae TaxID=2806101 RepID=A0ABS1Y0R1_9ACTN|nr:hypothetical protein [Micromonospora parastrephiae]MBM0235107.1 hypothetical protein [Micromonospora parastrephiae]
MESAAGEQGGLGAAGHGTAPGAAVRVDGQHRTDPAQRGAPAAAAGTAGGVAGEQVGQHPDRPAPTVAGVEGAQRLHQALDPRGQLVDPLAGVSHLGELREALVDGGGLQRLRVGVIGAGLLQVGVPTQPAGRHRFGFTAGRAIDVNDVLGVVEAIAQGGDQVVPLGGVSPVGASPPAGHAQRIRPRPVAREALLVPAGSGTGHT